VENPFNIFYSHKAKSGQWFSLGTVSATSKTDHHDITEILLKVALNTINQPTYFHQSCWVLSGEATNTNFIVFGLTRPWFEPTIYRTQGEHANHYTTAVVLMGNKILIR
jgi:hypothetical protein